jgi:hypothetical protein
MTHNIVILAEALRYVETVIASDALAAAPAHEAVQQTIVFLPPGDSQMNQFHSERIMWRSGLRFKTIGAINLVSPATASL